MSVDHKEPAGALSCYDDLPGFVERLFCGEEGMQVLCDDCHSKKSKEENRVRRESKKNDS